MSNAHILFPRTPSLFELALQKNGLAKARMPSLLQEPFSKKPEFVNADCFSRTSCVWGANSFGLRALAPLKARLPLRHVLRGEPPHGARAAAELRGVRPEAPVLAPAHAVARGVVP